MLLPGNTSCGLNRALIMIRASRFCHHRKDTYGELVGGHFPFVFAWAGKRQDTYSNPERGLLFVPENTCPPRMSVVNGIIPTPPSERLMKKSGKTYRKQENSIQEAMYVVGRWCPPGGKVIDDHCGTGVSGMASLFLASTYVGVEKNIYCASAAHVRLQRQFRHMIQDGKVNLTDNSIIPADQFQDWSMTRVQQLDKEAAPPDYCNGPEGTDMTPAGLAGEQAFYEVVVKPHPEFKQVGDCLFCEKPAQVGTFVLPYYGHWRSGSWLTVNRGNKRVLKSYISKERTGETAYLEGSLSCAATYGNDAAKPSPNPYVDDQPPGKYQNNCMIVESDVHPFITSDLRCLWS